MSHRSDGKPRFRSLRKPLCKSKTRPCTTDNSRTLRHRCRGRIELYGGEVRHTAQDAPVQVWTGDSFFVNSRSSSHDTDEQVPSIGSFCRLQMEPKWEPTAPDVAEYGGRIWQVMLLTTSHLYKNGPARTPSGLSLNQPFSGNRTSFENTLERLRFPLLHDQRLC